MSKILYLQKISSKAKAFRTSLTKGEQKSQKRRTLNSDFFFLYLQRLECLKNKLNEIKYKLECVLISKKSKKIGFISIKTLSCRAEHLGQSALGKCRSALQEYRQALLGDRLMFEFWFDLDSFFEDFLAGNCTQTHF